VANTLPAGKRWATTGTHIVPGNLNTKDERFKAYYVNLVSGEGPTPSGFNAGARWT